MVLDQLNNEFIIADSSLVIKLSPVYVTNMITEKDLTSRL
jgi:hypothetical protein